VCKENHTRFFHYTISFWLFHGFDEKSLGFSFFEKTFYFFAKNPCFLQIKMV